MLRVTMMKPSLFLALFLVGSCSAAKILLLPFDHGGHVNMFTVTAASLAAKGHQVVMVTPQRNRHILEKYNVSAIYNKNTKSQSPVENYRNVEASFLEAQGGFKQILHVRDLYMNMTKNFIEYCYEIMGDEDVMVKLRGFKFDIALVDTADFGRCNLVLPYRLKIPYISLGPRPDAWSVGVGAMPSTEGAAGMHRTIALLEE